MVFTDVMNYALIAALCLVGTWSTAILVVAIVRPSLLHLLLPAAIATALGAAPAMASPGDAPGLGGLPHLDRPNVTQVAAAPLDDPLSANSPGSANSPASAPRAHTPPRAEPHTDVTTATVRPGDSLWSIAERHLPPDATDAQVAHAVTSWYSQNREVIGDDPDIIHPGQQLREPKELA